MDIDVEDTTCKTAKTHKFDTIIGHIEDIIIGDRFQQTQDSFMEKNYREFEDTEENKLVYTDIFREYTSKIEQCLGDELKKRIPEFSMETFMSTLQRHKNEIVGDIFEMLLSFTDFISFKEMILDYKAEKEGRNMGLNNGFVVIPLNSTAGSGDSEEKGSPHNMEMSSG